MEWRQEATVLNYRRGNVTADFERTTSVLDRVVNI